eukprot:g4233.t1
MMMMMMMTGAQGAESATNYKCTKRVKTKYYEHLSASNIFRDLLSRVIDPRSTQEHVDGAAEAFKVCLKHYSGDPDGLIALRSLLGQMDEIVGRLVEALRGDERSSSRGDTRREKRDVTRKEAKDGDAAAAISSTSVFYSSSKIDAAIDRIDNARRGLTVANVLRTLIESTCGAEEVQESVPPLVREALPSSFFANMPPPAVRNTLSGEARDVVVRAFMKHLREIQRRLFNDNDASSFSSSSKPSPRSSPPPSLLFVWFLDVVLALASVDASATVREITDTTLKALLAHFLSKRHGNIFHFRFVEFLRLAAYANGGESLICLIQVGEEKGGECSSSSSSASGSSNLLVRGLVDAYDTAALNKSSARGHYITCLDVLRQASFVVAKEEKIAGEGGDKEEKVDSFLGRQLKGNTVWESFLLRIDDELTKTLPPPKCGNEDEDADDENLEDQGNEDTEEEDELECDSDLDEEETEGNVSSGGRVE